MVTSLYRLFYGDNLDVLRRHVADDSVDLVYLDPPFKSNQDYNVLFTERDGTQAAAQLHAFEDSWTWDQSAARMYGDVVERGGRVSEALQAFRTLLGTSDMLAYLAMMAPRLVELRRVLKATGSLYLHCDPTTSHYLKLLLDAVFGPENHRNDIIWRRSVGHSDARRQFGDQADHLLFYAKTPGSTFNVQYAAYSETYLKSHYSQVDERGRRYSTRDLRSPHPRPNLTYDYKGYKPHPNGWSLSIEKMREYDAKGLLYFPPSKSGRIRLKRYLEEMPGTPVGNVWDDISPLNSQAQERLGYATQKPEALLERIIAACTNEGDVVLDPFCGCGTTIAAAQGLQRRWIGIDITQAAIVIIKNRFRDRFKIELEGVVGEPTTLTDAKELAGSDPYQFQWWALGLVDARPTEEKKGADRGIDGRRYSVDPLTGKTHQAILSVKAGGVSVPHVRDLRGVIERERAQQGVLLSFEEPTRQMRAEAASAGVIDTAWGKMPRLQLVTVAQLLAGTSKLQLPPARQVGTTFKKAPRVATRKPEQPTLLPDEDVKRLPARASKMAHAALGVVKAPRQKRSRPA